MLELEAAELATAQAHYARFLAEAKLGDREQHDNSDIAEARENADLAAAFDHPVKDHHAKIDVLENLDFSVCDMIGPGAVVRSLRLARWGLVPGWAKDPSIGARMINARIETLADIVRRTAVPLTS